jgi:hypothetical protein
VFYKKSAEAGCSWGQPVYGLFFRDGGDFVEKDTAVNMEWVEKAVKQNNPWAMWSLGLWFGVWGGDDKEKAFLYYRAAAELGSKLSMIELAEMLRTGEGCAKDLRQSVMWSAKSGHELKFWEVMRYAAVTFGEETDLGCDLDQLCYSLGWGSYWYLYGSEQEWNERSEEEKAFGEFCLDYYCSCVELQQKSIFTFLLCWNQTVGVKGPGQMIAQMVWDQREDKLLKLSEENEEEPETKRIKK